MKQVYFLCPLIYRDGSKKAHRERDEEGCTPLLVAAKNGDEETLYSLLQHIAHLSVSIMLSMIKF